VAFSPDGKTLASAGNGVPIRLWQVSSGRKLAQLMDPGDYVHSLAFSSDGQILASGSGSVRLWSLPTGKEIHPLAGHFEGHADPLDHIASSPDGQLLASASSDGTIRLWHASTG